MIMTYSGQAIPPTKYVYNYSQNAQNPQKTPMCRIAELARYNKVSTRFYIDHRDVILRLHYCRTFIESRDELIPS